jgi:hypothetical protein
MVPTDMVENKRTSLLRHTGSGEFVCTERLRNEHFEQLWKLHDEVLFGAARLVRFAVAD